MKKYLVFIVFFITEIIHAQCAMCKAVVESGNEKIAEGINTGILYLMVFPYLLVGALLYFIVKHKRK